MLEKPALSEESVATCLQEAYGLALHEVGFLPLGADPDTAVFRAIDADGSAYFVKVRGGYFDPGSVVVPRYLSERGVRQVIPPLLTRAGEPYAHLQGYLLLLFPFVEGQNAFEVAMSDRQRVELGAALKELHQTNLPPAVSSRMRWEYFSSQWRETVKLFLARIEHERFDEPVAAALAAFLRGKRAETRQLVARAEALARALQRRRPDFCLCHGDVHGWNLLVGADGNLYIVDWDTLIFAPKERDLMFVGNGFGGLGHTPAQEEALFYRGYGRTEVNPIALAYYQFERIVEDIAVICEQIFLSDAGGADRRRQLAMLKSNFEPGGTIETAYRADPAKPRR